jgi:hypothetical protein
MEKNIENETPNQSIKTLKVALRGKIHPFISSQTSNIISPEELKRINEIHRIEYCTSHMLLWNFDKISLKKLKKTSASVKRYFTKLDETAKLLRKYSALELNDCELTLEKYKKVDLLTVKLWNILDEEIWKRRFVSLQLAVFHSHRKSAESIYSSFNKRNEQIAEELRNSHQWKQVKQFDCVVSRSADRIKNLEESTRNLIREKILQIDSDKNLCKNFREFKEIIGKYSLELSKIYHSHFSLINKSLRKYIKSRKFFPIFRVININKAYKKKAYNKKSISKTTALNRNEIINVKKRTSKIYEIDQFVKNIVASSSMMFNWKYRKKNCFII